MKCMLQHSNLFVMIIIVVSLLFGGLLYPEYFFALSAFVFLMIVFVRNDIAVNRWVLLISCIAVLYGLLMCFAGINCEKAIVGVFKMMVYAVVFLLFSSHQSGEKLIGCVMKTAVWCSIFCFIINLLALAYGTLPITDGNKAFSLVIPYSNTLGLWFAISAVWCLYENKKTYYFLHAVCFLGMLMTYSYGAVAVYFLTILIYLFMQKKYKIFLFMATVLVMAAIVILPRVSLSGFAERGLYYKDALKIFCAFPFGVGDGGWSSIYAKYQSGIYATENVHSSLFQAVVDFGIIGVFLYFAFLFLFIYFYKVARKNNNVKTDGVMLVCFMIWLHSLIDSDFQFPLIIFVLTAGMVYMIKESGKADLSIKRPFILKTCCVCASVLCLMLSFSFFQYVSGYENFEKGDTKKAQTNFASAVKTNPFSSSAYYMLYQITKDERHIQKAIKLDKYNPKNFAALAANSENKEDALLELLERQPYNINAYDKLFVIYNKNDDYDKIEKLKELFLYNKSRLSPFWKANNEKFAFELTDSTEMIIANAEMMIK